MFPYLAFTAWTSIHSLTTAHSHSFQEKNEEAWPLFERSLGIREKALGPGHPDVADVLDNQAWVLTEQVRAIRSSVVLSTGWRCCSEWEPWE